jgi:capsular exopolysaccharide synthesis family protein
MIDEGDNPPGRSCQDLNTGAKTNMSRIDEALRRMELERRSLEVAGTEKTQPVEFLQSVVPEPPDFRGIPSLKIKIPAASRLVALTEPQALGAEKFRALATRLKNLRRQRNFKSLQITSSLAHEGKTLVALNLALTFAQDLGSKVLFLEGDLRRPTLGSLLGLSDLRGISHWWSARDQELSRSLYRFGHMPLWLLSAGSACDQPSSILQSPRFAEALLPLVGAFDWIVVDSTPLLPFVDANQWSRLLDGMLLVVREGIASVKALKSGLESIDNPNLVGVVFNDTSEFGQTYYEDKYYSLQKQEKGHS